jgi:hypothetical protein
MLLMPPAGHSPETYSTLRTTFQSNPARLSPGGFGGIFRHSVRFRSRSSLIGCAPIHQVGDLWQDLNRDPSSRTRCATRLRIYRSFIGCYVEGGRGVILRRSQVKPSAGDRFKSETRAPNLTSADNCVLHEAHCVHTFPFADDVDLAKRELEPERSRPVAANAPATPAIALRSPTP